MKKYLQHPYIIVFIAYSIMIIILFNPVTIGGKVFASPDSLNPSSAAMIIEESMNKTGELPLWQPWIFSGMPTIEAFTYSSILYFPWYLLHAVKFPAALFHLLHFIVAGIGVFVLCRRLKLSGIPSFLAGATFISMPYLITMEVFGHGSQMMTAAFIPWALWAIIGLYNRPTLKDVGWLALILGLQLQRGHIQIAYYTWLLVGAYVLFKLIESIRKKNNGLLFYSKSLGYIAVSMLLALGIAYLLYMPSMEYSEFSIRGSLQPGGAGYDYATSWSFHPKEMLTFFIPSAYGFGGLPYWGHMPFTDFPNYMGLIVLMLALAGILLDRRGITLFLSITVVLALLLSFGKHFSLIYDLFYRFAPFFNNFRVPSMVLIIVQFSVSILAAIGLESIITKKWKIIPKWWLMGSAGIAIIALILLFGGGLIESVLQNKYTVPRVQDPQAIQAVNAIRWNTWYTDAWMLVLYLGLFFGFLWLFNRTKVKRILLIGGLIVVALYDIGSVDHRIIQPGQNSGRNSQFMSKLNIGRYFQADAVVQFLQDQPGDFRVYPLGPYFNDSRLRAFGIESVGGYHPAKLRIYNRFLEATGTIGSIPLMRMMNIHYLLSPQTISHPDLQEAYIGKYRTSQGLRDMFIYQLLDHLPRAWFVNDVVGVEAIEQVWLKVTDPDFDPAQTAIILESLQFTGGDEARVESIERSPNFIRLKTSGDGGFLVLSEVHYPKRWKSTVDGITTDIIETNGILRGVAVPEGNRTVEFYYEKSGFRKNLWVSIGSFFVALMMIGAALIPKKENYEPVS